MVPVAVGIGEGGEFYSPMAVAIIGGTLVSTLLTLLVVPSFYDSIEIAAERASAKMHARADLGNPVVAFFVTVFEALFTLLFLRMGYRGICTAFGIERREHPVLRRARLTGEPPPRAWEAPKKSRREIAVSTNPYAARPTPLD
jgi:hypothetical protein